MRDILPACDTQVVSLEDFSTEGALLTAYSHEGSLLMLHLDAFYESGRVVTDFLFEKRQSGLFFFDTQTIYNRPIYWDSTKAGEMGDTEFFDPEKSKITEFRMYFFRTTFPISGMNMERSSKHRMHPRQRWEKKYWLN
ncbi:MAG: hypothetical protein R3B47_18145 [Bacteroidia bacterium]